MRLDGSHYDHVRTTYTVYQDEQESPVGVRVAPGPPLFTLKTHYTPASNLSFVKKICTKYIKYILCNAKNCNATSSIVQSRLLNDLKHNNSFTSCKTKHSRTYRRAAPALARRGDLYTSQHFKNHTPQSVTRIPLLHLIYNSVALISYSRVVLRSSVAYRVLCLSSVRGIIIYIVYFIYRQSRRGVC